jgi:hypothetical protein
MEWSSFINNLCVSDIVALAWLCTTVLVGMFHMNVLTLSYDFIANLQTWPQTIFFNTLKLKPLLQ